MMVPVLAILDSLVVTVISALAPTTASATDTVSMVHAIAALAGLVMIALKKCAPVAVQDMANVSMLLVSVNRVILVLIAHS